MSKRGRFVLQMIATEALILVCFGATILGLLPESTHGESAFETWSRTPRQALVAIAVLALLCVVVMILVGAAFYRHATMTKAEKKKLEKARRKEEPVYQERSQIWPYG